MKQRGVWVEGGQKHKEQQSEQRVQGNSKGKKQVWEKKEISLLTSGTNNKNSCTKEKEREDGIKREERKRAEKQDI